MRYPEALKGMTAALSWQDGCPKGLNRVRSKIFTFVTVPAAFKAPLAGDFAHGKKKLQPLVFSHAEAADRMIYSGLFRELASYGFLVVALNHNDQTCMHTKGRPLAEAVEDIKPKILGNEDGPIEIEESKTLKPEVKKPKVEAQDRTTLEREVIKFDKST